jgi:hypothetical protein
MTRTEYALQKIAQTLKERQQEIDAKKNLRSISFLVLFDKLGKVYAVEIAPNERRVFV